MSTTTQIRYEARKTIKLLKEVKIYRGHDSLIFLQGCRAPDSAENIRVREGCCCKRRHTVGCGT